MPGSSRRPSIGVGKAARHVGGDDVGAFLEVAGARIVAEPGPRLHDVVGLGAGKRRDVRPFREEGAEIGLHRFDRRLLQHDFGQPDVIGVGPAAGCDRIGEARATADRGDGGRTRRAAVAAIAVVAGSALAGAGCAVTLSPVIVLLARYIRMALMSGEGSWQGKAVSGNPVPVSDLASADPRSGAAQARRHLDRARAVLGGDRRPAACRANSRPEKIVWPRRMHEDDPFQPATLVIACEGLAALHLQHETGEIIGRVNAFLGFTAIGRIRIVQKPVQRRRRRAKAAAASAFAEPKRHALSGTSAVIEDEGLRASLERLGARFWAPESQDSADNSRFRDCFSRVLAIGLGTAMP